MTGSPSIDRRAVVERHDVRIDGVLADAPLSVGNGEFAATVDVTGLQTFPDAYPLPDRDGGPAGTLLSTMAQWAWHTFPDGHDHGLAEARRWYDTPRGAVPYVDLADGEITGDGAVMSSVHASSGSGAGWLRANPHRLDLARIGFVLIEPDGGARVPRPNELGPASQRLELWSGTIHSRSRLAGHEIEVTTACHPDSDTLALRLRGEALAARRLGVQLAFPGASSSWNVAADWSRPDAHRSDPRLVAAAGDANGRGADDRCWVIDRTLDETRVRVSIRASSGTELVPDGPHRFVLATETDQLDLTIRFAPGPSPSDPHDAHDPHGPPDAEATFDHARRWWAEHWSHGGAIDLGGSTDPRAPELERRIVLSRYLTAVNAAGSLPPQETGLVCNSWHGKFHLEMHWWHGVHHVLWGHGELLERSLGFYEHVLDRARATARDQGLPGARWPKQVGPDGRESPSPIAPFLLWQQPHPIHLAEVLRRAATEGADDARDDGSLVDGARADARRIVERYGEVVLETATFMAALPVLTDRGYELAPPLVPAQEAYADQRATTTNPTFELAQWAWALRVAQRWRALLGLEREPAWDAVADGLVRPHIRDGVYTAIDREPYTLRRDHPSMLYAYGMIPPTPLIEADTMRRTLHGVLADWDWDTTWGWDFPAMAMTATRLGEPVTALDVLLMDVPKNRYLVNGHNRQTPTLPVYLPGNGGLLAAVAMMAAGFDGGPSGGVMPGFPDDGRWQVRHEHLLAPP